MAARKRRNDKGNVLVGVLVSMVLMGFMVSMSARQLMQGSLASLRARSHTEAVAVASWKAAEFGVSGCPITSIAPVMALGPDELSTPEGFEVTCSEAYVDWPPVDPPPTTTIIPRVQPPPPQAVTVTTLRSSPSGAHASIVTVTVEWDARGSPRSLQQSIVLQAP